MYVCYMIGDPKKLLTSLACKDVAEVLPTREERSVFRLRGYITRDKNAPECLGIGDRFLPKGNRLGAKSNIKKLQDGP